MYIDDDLVDYVRNMVLFSLVPLLIIGLVLFLGAKFWSVIMENSMKTYLTVFALG